MKKAGTGLIGEIVRQLVAGEIDHDMASKIAEHRFRVASGDSIRVRQARILYQKFGDILGCSTFEHYLDAQGCDSFEPVPQIPMWSNEQVRLFGMQNVCLVDRRVVNKIGLKQYCYRAGLVYRDEDDSFEVFDAKRAKKESVYWMLFQDGFRNRNRRPSSCCNQFQSFEVGMDHIEGVSIFVQTPSVVDGHYMNLPGSVTKFFRGDIAGLGCINDDVRPHLTWQMRDIVLKGRGTASRAA